MRVSILPRVRWRILEWLLPFLLVTILVNNIEPISGAPQTHSRFSVSQRQQNPSFRQAGTFRIIPDEDDFEDIVFANSRQRNFGNGSPSSVGVPLSATQSGIPREHLNAGSAHFGVPLSASTSGIRSNNQQSQPQSFGVPLSSSTSGVRSNNQQTQPQSFGIPLSATQSGSSQDLSEGVRSHFGVPLSATRAEIIKGTRKETIGSRPSTHHRASQDFRPPFGVPLSETHSGSRQQTNNVAKHHFGSSQAQPGPAFSVRRESLEDVIDDVSVEARSHFSLPTHRNLNRERFSFDSDDRYDRTSSERFDKSSEILSLGRRFHPEGIPRLSDATLTNIPLSAKDPVISNPYIFTSGIASIDRDSIEDDDDDSFVVLSPMVKAYNPSAHNERLSLSNDFLNQYNFVDVQGSTHWGYKTDSQYQDHKIHDSGTMEGNFGWTSPEGSQVNIKYIADEGGYRVVSSSGIYTKEDDDVLRLKELHLAEHEKAKVHHQNIKAERKEGKIGVPLPPTDYRGSQGSAISGSGGFVIVPDEDDLPLIPPRTQTGVPLPNFSGTDIMSEPEVGVFIDSGAVGVPLPTPSQDRNTFGIPLPEQEVTRHHPTSVPQSPHSFGVPLPDPSLVETQGVGVPLPGVTLSGSSRDQIGGVPLPETTLLGTQDVGVPLPDPTFTINEDVGVSLPDPTLSGGDQGVGVPLPDSTFVGSHQPESTFSGSQGVGVPLPDPTFSGTTGTGVSRPSQTFSGDVHPSQGVPLPDPTFSGGSDVKVPLQEISPSGASRDQTVGVPLPSPTFSETSRDHTAGVSVSDPSLAGTPEAGVPLPETTFSGDQNVIPQSDQSLSGFQGVGVPLPPFMPGSQGAGIPFPDSTFSGTPEHGSVGVPLSGTSQRLPHEGTSGVTLPDQFFSEHQNFGVPLFDPVLTNQQGTIPQSDLTISGNEAFGVPVSAFSGHQTTGVSLPDRASVGGPGKDSVLFSDQNFGVPLSGGIDIHEETKEPSLLAETSTFDSTKKNKVVNSDLENEGAEKLLPSNIDSTQSLTSEMSTPAGHELKVTFIDTQSSSDSIHPIRQEFGVPLSATTTLHIADKNFKNNDHKTPTKMDPLKIFGLATLSTDSTIPSDSILIKDKQDKSGVSIFTTECATVWYKNTCS